MAGCIKLCCRRRSTPTPIPAPPNESPEPVEIVENTVPPQIIIDICLYNVIAEENKNITLYCALANLPEDDLTVTWTKNGEVLQSTRRIGIQSYGKDHKLIITYVSQQDQGIYVILFKHRGIVSFSKGLLFIKPADPNLTKGVIYLKTNHRYTTGILLQLISKKVYVGGVIEQDAYFKHRKIQEYLWFKNGQTIKEGEHLSLFSDDRRAILYIKNAKVTDSGIYHVVTKTRYGISSSFADILVLNLDPQIVLDSEIIPHIDQHLPKVIEAYEGEEVRMITKISYDVNTDFSWTKGLESLECKNNIEIVFYNNQYISLKLNYVSLTDSGIYCLTVRDLITDSSTSTYCNLVVKRLPKQKYLTTAKILVPLNSAVAYVGSAVVYRCKYEVENPQYCCALWEVGPYQVERTSNKYCIFCNGTDFFLFIKKVEPDMAGIISCRICKVIPRRKSYSLRISTASLTIVPSIVTKDIANGLPLADNKTWFYRTYITEFVQINKQESAEINENEPERKRTEVDTEPLVKVNLYDSRITASRKAPIYDDDPSTSKSFVELGKIVTENTSENVTMHITFFRCDETEYWIDVTSNAPRAFGHVAVQEVLQEVYNRATGLKWETILKFEWQEISNVWYAIDIHDEKDLIGSGVTSTPSFSLKQIPYEMILKFRICAVKPFGDQITSLVISLEVNESESSTPKHLPILPMSDYGTLFSEPEEHIGHGAFGRIMLVQDTEGVSYAAKIIKTSLERKKIRAFREYKLLNILEHPNIVKVHLAFHEKENFTIIMDYHCGGDLLQRLKQVGRLKEYDVIVYVRQICEALHYVHSHGIVHLDIKPANIICVNPNSRLVKLADFGLARKLQENNPVRALYVTREFVPPEILSYAAVSKACDMWSFGVLTYMLLSGVPPFTGANIHDTIHSISIAQYKYDHPAFREVSDLSKDFISRILLLIPENRLTAEQALEHDWLKDPRGGVRSNLMFQPKKKVRNYIAQ